MNPKVGVACTFFLGGGGGGGGGRGGNQSKKMKVLATVALLTHC